MYVYPRSRILIFSIPDPGSKEFILAQKIVSKLLEI
jgi:hypothetical protein